MVAAPGSKVRCPHCEIVAVTGGFLPAQGSELAGRVVDPFHDEELGGHAECILEGNFMQFECPYCQRAMKMLNEEAGGLADCPHCGLEIVSPQPDHGDGPRLTEASRRQLGNLLRLKPGNLQVHKDGVLPLQQAFYCYSWEGFSLLLSFVARGRRRISGLQPRTGPGSCP